MQPSYEEKTEKFSMIRKKPHHVPPHLHNAIELVYVTKGELELGIGYELYHMEKGDFAVVFPDLIHHYQVFSKGSNEVYQFYASLELSGPFMTLLQKKCPENPVMKKADLPYEIRNSLGCLIRMGEVNEIVGQAYLQIMLYQCSKLFQFIEKDNVGSHDLIYTVIIALGTVVSSLQSDRLTRKLGTGKVTAISVAMTAAALFGFSFSHSFWMLCLWAIPYGLGAGSVDASLNNYVALHYESRHMSWLHCMWGVGASLGPYIMGFALTGGKTWNAGYRWIGMLQVVLTVILFLSLPMWKGRKAGEEQGKGEEADKILSLPEIIRIPGAKEVLICFFCYCAVEQTAGLWASSYLVLYKGMAAETAAGFASMFYIGITLGRAASGFMTMKFNDTQMIRLGLGTIALGIVVMLIPMGANLSVAGLILIGLGCAPVYPCVIHSTPAHFGADKSQAIIGGQMGMAYV